MEMDFDRWLSHFRANRESRPEPDWSAPISLSPVVARLERRDVPLKQRVGPAIGRSVV